MKKDTYLHKESASAPKILGLVILVLFVFALGWNVGANQVRQNGDNYFIETQISRTTTDEKVDMQLFWDVWSLLASKYVDPQALDYKNMISVLRKPITLKLGKLIFEIQLLKKKE